MDKPPKSTDQPRGTAWQELETTLPRSSKSVATTSWTAYKSGKVTDTADGDHFVIAPESTAILRTLELTTINL